MGDVLEALVDPFDLSSHGGRCNSAFNKRRKIQKNPLQFYSRTDAKIQEKLQQIIREDNKMHVIWELGKQIGIKAWIKRKVPL